MQGRSEMATYYVSSSAGKDSNNGTSVNTPWKTISKVNSSPLRAGDIVCLKCGDSWRETLVPHSGKVGSYIKYTKYGTGNLPSLIGSAQANNAVQWVNAGANLWNFDIRKLQLGNRALPYDIGNVIVAGDICGWKYLNIKNLKKQLDYYFDPIKLILTLYSTQNPTVLYKNIELSLTDHIINGQLVSCVTIDSLELKYGGLHGYSGSGSNYTTITNCIIHHMGGAAWQSVRAGNGIEFYDTAHDCLVLNNQIYQIYDSAISNQGSSRNAAQYNITYKGNTIDRCELSYEYWLNGPGATMHDINFIDNTCTNAGKGWSHLQRPDPLGTHVIQWNNSSNRHNINITGNKFDTASERLLFIGSVKQLTPSHFDYNTYIQPINDASHSYLLFSSYDAPSIKMSDYMSWVKQYNQDKNSTFNGKKPF